MSAAVAAHVSRRWTGSTSWVFFWRVSSAAIIAACGECWPRIAMRSSISARRVENAFSTFSGMPTMSAMPFFTSPHSTPSATVRLWRSWAS